MYVCLSLSIYIYKFLFGNTWLIAWHVSYLDYMGGPYESSSHCNQCKDLPTFSTVFFCCLHYCITVIYYVLFCLINYYQVQVQVQVYGIQLLIKLHCSSISLLLIFIHLLDSNAESDDVIMDAILIGSHEHKYLPLHSRVPTWPFLCIHDIHKRHPMAFAQGLEWVFLAATKQL